MLLYTGDFTTLTYNKLIGSFDSLSNDVQQEGQTWRGQIIKNIALQSNKIKEFNGSFLSCLKNY